MQAKRGKPWWKPLDGRLRCWPLQGEYVRMAEAPCVPLAGMVGWVFQVVRRDRAGLVARLRAPYSQTPNVSVELVFSGLDSPAYFEAA